MEPLTSGDLETATEPFDLFQTWMRHAEASEPNDPNAMALATVDADGLPDVRMVLLKDFGPSGFTFYTNRDSAKGVELQSGKAALVLHWKSLRRQVRARGTVSPATSEEADAYFASRHRSSQIGARVSQQSRPLESRAHFEAAVAAENARLADQPVPRPAYWGGFRIVPQAIEFWMDRPYRLHDRLLFTRTTAGDPWTRTRLYP